jgi:lipopolysaccharide biosynthesis regulator YciM
MNRKSVQALTTALLIGATAGVAAPLITSTPAYSSAAIKIENKALADAINGAQADAKAGHFADALAKAKTADAIAGKPMRLTREIHQMITAYAISAKDYSSALAQLDKMIAANEGDRKKNLSDAFAVSLQSGNQQRAMNYANQLGNDLGPQERLYLAQGYFKAGKFKEALREVQPLREGRPSEALLLFLEDIYAKMNDEANRRASLEELVTNYPKPQYWHDLLQIARNERGLTDEQSLDIYRLRLALGDLKTDVDYEEMAQLALVAGYPNEAKSVLDEASAA